MSNLKMLFSDAPPDALEKLLSPRRKAIYALFAFGPGTVLGLYLYSVKRRMDRENEAIRLEQVQSELSVVQEQENKDLVLANAIREMRDRLQRLEAEAVARRQSAANVAKAAEESAKLQGATKAPAALTESTIEAALATLKPKKKPQEQEQEQKTPTWMTSPLGGQQGRIQQRQKDMIKEDVAAYQAGQKKQNSN
ncbi:hypothetical protein PHYBOEH_007248 [Phytophthora boehmeriae]|uniref:Uncharacterized protein n=1 Tax=Phytophthora boehmeriae TaxID=109152 RepID=A0A8T1X9H6_9STRA|nr:hypothetical protein PHYBOEH_007248 [Phytophthora boehmeriae]